MPKQSIVIASPLPSFVVEQYFALRDMNPRLVIFDHPRFKFFNRIKFLRLTLSVCSQFFFSISLIFDSRRYQTIFINYPKPLLLLVILMKLSGHHVHLHFRGSDIRPFTTSFLHSVLSRFLLHISRSISCSTPDLIPVVNTYNRNLDVKLLLNPIHLGPCKYILKKSESRSNQIVVLANLAQNKGSSILIDSILSLNHLDLFPILISSVDPPPNLKLTKHLKSIEHNLLQDLLQDTKVVIGQMHYDVFGRSEIESLFHGCLLICKANYEINYPLLYRDIPPCFSCTNPTEISLKVQNFLSLASADQNCLSEHSHKWASKHHSIAAYSAKLRSICSDAAKA